MSRWDTGRSTWSDWAAAALSRNRWNLRLVLERLQSYVVVLCHYVCAVALDMPVPQKQSCYHAVSWQTKVDDIESRYQAVLSPSGDAAPCFVRRLRHP